MTDIVTDIVPCDEPCNSSELILVIVIKFSTTINDSSYHDVALDTTNLTLVNRLN